MQLSYPGREPGIVAPYGRGVAALHASARSIVLGLGLTSGVINILGLTGSFYMLQVYDRVLASHSVPTLVGLTIIMVTLYGLYGALDGLRTQIFGRSGLKLDRLCRQAVFEGALKAELAGRRHQSAQASKDLDQLRSFLMSAAPIALFDLPWLPLYLAAVFLLHHTSASWRCSGRR